MRVEQYTDPNGQILTVKYHSKYDKSYYNFNNKFHRLDGPAVIFNNSYVWYKEGERHRLGGPAFCDDYFNYYEWYIDDREVNIYYIYG